MEAGNTILSITRAVNSGARRTVKVLLFTNQKRLTLHSDVLQTGNALVMQKKRALRVLLAFFKATVCQSGNFIRSKSSHYHFTPYYYQDGKLITFSRLLAATH